jgi:hypothetical protein
VLDEPSEALDEVDEVDEESLEPAAEVVPSRLDVVSGLKRRTPAVPRTVAVRTIGARRMEGPF